MKSIKQSMKVVGMKDKEADVLNWFFQNTEGTSRQVERELQMRQPEVSVITSDFLGRDWLAYTEFKKGSGKGRPEKKYKLLKNKSEIMGQMADELTERINELHEARTTLQTA